MPARDIYHDAVRHALEKDGWTITDDPLRLEWGRQDVYVDLGAERLLAAEKAERKIAVEIKSFRSLSIMKDLEQALGQRVVYRRLLKHLEPDRRGEIEHMDTLNHYRELIENILSAYAAIPYRYGDLQCDTIFDRTQDRYLLITQGWENGKRVHYVVAHLEIINGKIWIQKDSTEEGVGEELLAEGVPPDHLVPGFRSVERRRDMGFAVA